MITKNGWSISPLLDKNVNEIIFARGNYEDLKKVSKSPNELIGKLYGVVKENGLYLFGNSILGEGDKKSVQLNPEYLEFHNEFVKRSKSVTPSFTSVLYHNHPKLSPEEYPKEIIEYLEKNLSSGIYDSLWKQGVRPSIKSAIEEDVARQLSPTDLSGVTGRLHVLVTDRERKNNNLSHIHAYKFDKDSIIGEEFFKVKSLEDNSRDVNLWGRGVSNSLNEVYEVLKKEYSGKVPKVKYY